MLTRRTRFATLVYIGACVLPGVGSAQPPMPIGGDFQVNTHTNSNQTLHAVGVRNDGDFVVAWGSDTQDGSASGVFAQRYQVPAVIDIDGNGKADPLTDGILMLRYLFGFAGETLVVGAVDEDGCTRCDAASIEAYLATLIRPSPRSPTMRA